MGGQPQHAISYLILSTVHRFCRNFLKDFIGDQINPLINIENSQDINFDKIGSSITPALFFSVNGDRSKQISVRSTNLTDVRHVADFKFGANKSDLTIAN